MVCWLLTLCTLLYLYWKGFVDCCKILDSVVLDIVVVRVLRNVAALHHRDGQESTVKNRVRTSPGVSGQDKVNLEGSSLVPTAEENMIDMKASVYQS